MQPHDILSVVYADYLIDFYFRRETGACGLRYKLSANGYCLVLVLAQFL